MCFLTEEFSLLMCSLTRSLMKRVVLPMYCWPQLLHVSWYTAFLRRHNPVLEIGHLSLVHLRSVEVGDRASLSESVGFVGDPYWDVFFPEDVSDPVIESFRDVRDLKI